MKMGGVGGVSMEAILQKILAEIEDMKTDMQGMKADMQGMKADITDIKDDTAELKVGQNELKDRVVKLETNTEMIYDQVANLTEFKTETKDKLDQIIDDIEFLKHQDFENKQDLFRLKKNMKISK